MQIKFSTTLMLAVSATALQVTSPSKDDKLDLTGSNKVTWDSVESDPTSFDIQLVNEHVNPPFVRTLATNVQTSAGSYTFSNVAAAVGDDYQINLVSDQSQNTGILAQSAQFDVTNAVSSSSSSSSSTSSGTSTSTSTSSTSTTSSSTTSSSTATSTTTSSGASSSGIPLSSSKTAIATSTSTSTSTSSSTSSGFSATHTGSAGTVAVSVVGCVVGSVFALLL